MQRKHSMVGAVLAVILLAACASGPTKAVDVYFNARVTFNDLLQSYVEAYETAPEDVQQKWTATITPWFVDGEKALDAWATLLGTSDDPQAQADAYIAIKNKIIALLIEVGVK